MEINIMRLPSFNILTTLEKILGIERTNKIVSDITQRMDLKVEEAVTTIDKVGKLQGQVLKKTTTYYIAKGTGGIK